jgi:hypothetical protein
LLLSPLWVGVLGELRGRPEPTTTTPPPPSGKKTTTTRRHTSYMSSCPFADLVVAVLLAAAVLVAAVHLACAAPRSMHKGLHGWNKSSSMLRSVPPHLLLLPFFKFPSFCPPFPVCRSRSGRFRLGFAPGSHGFLFFLPAGTGSG